MAQPPSSSLSDAALIQQVRDYIEYEPDTTVTSHLTALLTSQDLPTLRTLFYPRIAFGTAGLRAQMSPGYHHINAVVITQTTQGVIRYLQHSQPDLLRTKGVVVGFDGRHHSKEWAELTAAIFLSADVPVRLFSGTCPTPLVPFTIQEEGLAAGVMVTASHNPASDNGYKLYWKNSAQIIPPMDEHISAEIAREQRPWQRFSLDRSHPLLSDPLHAMQQRYTALIGEKYCWRRQQNLSTPLRVTYTAMHGVGAPWTAKAFEAFGLPPFIPVPEQIEADPDFPTVKFPNPEEGADSPLIIANDPDADRLAVAEKSSSGEWVCLNGNQIGLLFADYVWLHFKASHPPSSYPSAFMLNSTVSSSIIARMAKKEGFHHEDTLTGFKWMGNRADELIHQGMTFLFAFEVEIGYLVGDISLDKDGVRCAAMFYELAAQLHSQGKSCMGRVEELEKELGASFMLNQYCICNDPRVFEAIFSRIRTMGPQGGYPTSVGGYNVTSVRDVPLGLDSLHADGKSRLPRVTDSFMITLRLEGGASITLRNSGTEPKLKYYVEAFDVTREQAKAACEAIKAHCMQELLQPDKHGLTLPK